MKPALPILLHRYSDASSLQTQRTSRTCVPANAPATCADQCTRGHAHGTALCSNPSETVLSQQLKYHGGVSILHVNWQTTLVELLKNEQHKSFFTLQEGCISAISMEC